MAKSPAQKILDFVAIGLISLVALGAALYYFTQSQANSRAEQEAQALLETPAGEPPLPVAKRVELGRVIVHPLGKHLSAYYFAEATTKLFMQDRNAQNQSQFRLLDVQSLQSTLLENPVEYTPPVESKQPHITRQLNFNQIHFSETEKYVAVTLSLPECDPSVRLVVWEVATGKIKLDLLEPNRDIQTFRFRGDRDILLLGKTREQMMMEIYSVETNEVAVVPIPHVKLEHSLFAAIGDHVVFGLSDGCQAFDLQKQTLRELSKNPLSDQKGCKDITYISQKQQLFVTRQSLLEVWDFPARKLLQTHPLPIRDNSQIPAVFPALNRRTLYPHTQAVVFETCDEPIRKCAILTPGNVQEIVRVACDLRSLVFKPQKKHEATLIHLPRGLPENKTVDLNDLLEN